MQGGGDGTVLKRTGARMVPTERKVEADFRKKKQREGEEGAKVPYKIEKLSL